MQTQMKQSPLTEKKPLNGSVPTKQLNPMDDHAAPGTLWAIEILFSHHTETKRFKLINKSNDELMKFRTNIFIAGFMYPIDPGHWVLISPFNILQIDVYKQANRFKEY